MTLRRKEGKKLARALALSSTATFPTVLHMAANPLDRVAQTLEQILPSGPSTPHLSGAETPPPFAWGGAGQAATGSPAEPATPQNGKRKTRLACLTSGGDSAGMNAAVRAVVKMAIAR